MVLPVLNQLIPVIHDKIKRLEEDVDITSNYTANLNDMEERDAQQENKGRILVDKKNLKRIERDNKDMKVQIVKQADDILKLQ